MRDCVIALPLFTKFDKMVKILVEELTYTKKMICRAKSHWAVISSEFSCCCIFGASIRASLSSIPDLSKYSLE